MTSRRGLQDHIRDPFACQNAALWGEVWSCGHGFFSWWISSSINSITNSSINSFLFSISYLLQTALKGLPIPEQISSHFDIIWASQTSHLHSHWFCFLVFRQIAAVELKPYSSWCITLSREVLGASWILCFASPKPDSSPSVSSKKYIRMIACYPKH